MNNEKNVARALFSALLMLGYCYDCFAEGNGFDSASGGHSHASRDETISLQRAPDAPELPNPGSPGDSNEGEAIKGYVLTHEHPFAEHAFGGTVMWGTIEGWPGPCDGGKDTNWSPNPFVQNGRPSHAGMKGWFIDGLFPDAGSHSQLHKPKWNSAFHHRYPQSGIRQAFEDGMKIMVAFLHENEVFCELAGEKWNHGARHYECSQGDSFKSLKRQIEIAKNWAEKISWTQVAYSAGQAREIIQNDKLALVLGVEADYSFGSPNSPFDPVSRLNRYYELGVRSFYFAHKINSRLAGASITVENRAGQYIHNDMYLDRGLCPKGQLHNPAGSLPGKCKPRLHDVAEASLPMYALANQFPNLPDPFESTIRNANNPGQTEIHHNQIGLKRAGERVMKEAMEKGMLLDIGHVSDRAQEEMWQLSQSNFDYPLNAFHSWPRTRMREDRIKIEVAGKTVVAPFLACALPIEL